MKIGKYFTLEELTANKAGLVNYPDTLAMRNLTSLVKNVLDPLREMYGKPITVNSGYRNIYVNKNVGGAPSSQHLKGEASDIDTKADNAELFKLIRENFVFDQLIWEGGDDKAPAWIHVSFKTQGNRNEVLKMKYLHGQKAYVRL